MKIQSPNRIRSSSPWKVRKHQLLLPLAMTLVVLWLLPACIPLGEEVPLPTQETLTELTATSAPPAATSTPEAQEAATPTLAPAPQQDTIFSVNEENFPQVSEADWFLYTGEYQKAKAIFEAQFDDPNANPEEKASALLGLGRIALLTGEESKAAQFFDNIIQNYPTSNASLDTYFFLGELYIRQNQPANAALAYQQFAYAAPQTLPALVWEKLGDAYNQSLQFPEAINAYQSTINALSDTDAINQVKSKIGQVYAAQDETDIAIQYYLDAYNNSENDYFRSRMNFYLGQTYLATGQADLAFDRFQTNITLYPYTYDAYSGLVSLIDNQQPVDEYMRGLTDYYAGAYGVAVDAFNRYIQDTPIPERNGNVHHYKAFSLIALEDYDGAIAEWQLLIDNFPTNEYFATAWDEIAYTQWVYLNSPKTAASTYLTFCDTYSNNSEVPDFLFYAARIYERFDELELAAQTWTRLATDFPTHSFAFRSLLLAGVSYYRQGQYDLALTSFSQLELAAANNQEKAAAYFWQAKNYAAQGNTTQSTALYESAVRSAPSAYYGIRADQVLKGLPPFSQNTNLNLSADLIQERKQAVIWMRSAFSIDPSTDLQSPGIIVNDPDYIRATDYWRLGFYQESLNTFDILRLKYENDPINSFRLLAILINHGFYRAAAFTAWQILDLSNIGETNFLAAPGYFNHIRYGVFYNDLIKNSVQQYDLEPLTIFTQIRQESLFESRVGSSAGAMGLLQIIPSTGTSIHEQMNFPDSFTTDMLFLPAVNLPMGVYYLDLQRDYFKGAMYPALAAYNAGPGNAAIWWRQAQEDPDLFLEIIRFSETRNYITLIVETRHTYQLLYQQVQ